MPKQQAYPVTITCLCYLLMVLPVFARAQAPQPKAYEQLMGLSAKLDSAYQSQMQQIEKLKLWQNAKETVSAGIVSGIDVTGRLIYTIEHNDGAAKAVRTEQLYPGGSLGFSLTGKGMTVGIWENGAPDPRHPEFGNRLVIKDQAEELRGHATHVSGTILATGINPSARGMAYEATGHVFSASNYLSEVAQAAAEGLLISNHSYGVAAGWTSGTWRGDPDISSEEDWKFGIYNSDAATLDRIALLAPYYLLIRSAGNDRGESGDGTFPADGPFDTMTGEAIAKNILSVGNVATNSDIPVSANDVDLVSSSSWGPSDDGRIKPDLVAPGAALLSPDHESEGGYDLKTGTSMSTPVTTGSAVLLQQLYNQMTGRYMKAATLKGLLLHTTLDVGRAPGPDYRFGHGYLDTRMAAEAITEQQHSELRETVLTENETLTFDFEVTSSVPLLVSISWTDPEGSPFEEAVLDPTNLNLVNDLDLRVVDPDGNVYEPWVLDPANPDRNATRGDNFRDNYEKIEIKNPVLGKHQLVITHKNSLQGGKQDFSLIATNLSRSTERSAFYWIGGSGNWHNGNNWSHESGGTGVGIVPGEADKAIIDSQGLSDGEVIFLNAPATVYQLTWLPETMGALDLNDYNLTVTAGLQAEDFNAIAEG
ncbi:MAG: S8 family serine peptidase, partial [Bacteroidota bacterium]